MHNSTPLFRKTCLVPLLILLILLSSCREPEPIKIGYIAGMTGRHSEVGIGARNGLTLAISTLNEQGGVNGRQLELTIKDNEGNPKHIAEAIDELLSMDISFIIGPLLSKMAKPMLKAIDGKDVLIGSPTMSTDIVSNLDDPFIRLIPESSFQGESIAAAILQTSYKRLAVVFDGANKAYTLPIFKVFKKEMDQAGKKIIYINDLKDGQEKELSKVANEIVDAKCDAIFFITSSIDAGELSQQIRKIDKTSQFYGAYWVKSGRIVEIGGRSVEGMILTTIFERAEKSAAYKDFAKRFETQFKVKPNFTSVYAYELMMTMAQGMKVSKSFDPHKVKQAIIKQGEFEGLEENYRINKYGDVERSKALIKIQDGHFVRVDI